LVFTSPPPVSTVSVPAPTFCVLKSEKPLETVCWAVTSRATRNE
jgi:hypothetical protein